MNEMKKFSYIQKQVINEDIDIENFIIHLKIHLISNIIKHSGEYDNNNNDLLKKLKIFFDNPIINLNDFLDDILLTIYDSDENNQLLGLSNIFITKIQEINDNTKQIKCNYNTMSLYDVFIILYTKKFNTLMNLMTGVYNLNEPESYITKFAIN